MSKTVKGARVRLKRSDTPTDIPTIPTNDDHTTGWLNTDIYIGEVFLNTSSTAPGMWFRDTSGTTKLAIMDRVTGKLPVTSLPSNITKINNTFTISLTITNTISIGTQYIVINDSSSAGVTAINDIELVNLETVGGVSIVHISLNTNLNGGTLTVRLKGSIGTVITTTDTNLRGIILMWDSTKWVVLSNTIN